MQVIINGKTLQTNKKTVFSLSPNFKDENVVVIVNGFQIDSDQNIKENDELFFIEKGVLPEEDVFETILCARHTPKIYNTLKRGRVAVAGLGGLGSHVAVALARSGVGMLTLIDFDVVEPSNLNRQHYSIAHLGLPKTQALKEQIKQISPFIKVNIKQAKLTANNVPELLSGNQIVCECFDKPSEKAMLVNTVLEKLPEVKLVASSGMAGIESSNTITTKRKMKNLYLCGDEITQAEEGRGLMAPRVQVCAGHQANMVLRLLVGMEEC